MSTALEVIDARVSQARFRFYKNHKNVAPNQANESLIEGWADTNLKSLEDVTTWNEAYEVLKDQLAKNKHNIIVERPRAEAPAPSPEPALEGQGLLRKLQADSKSDNPSVAFDAVDRLKKLAYPQQDGESDKEYFVRIYSPNLLRRASEPQLSFLRKRYGATLVSYAINRTQ
jgi:hypothetical protein